MVVLSVGIVASNKTLLARQYVEMTRLRVEGLFSAFPKLVEGGRDHTFIETETVRYVYQPMESLHILLVTNKNSNILEDLETLRLLAKVVQDCCQLPVNEELVLKHIFDIIFAFDEVVSFGYRESVTLAQIKTYTEMDSHEEKLHQMLEQSKINEAREQAKKKQQELSKLRASQPKDSHSMPGIAGPAPGSTAQESMDTRPADPFAGMPAPTPAPWSGSLGATEDGGASTLRPNAPKKGMMLGKKKPVDVLGGMGVPAEPSPAGAPEQEAAAPASAPAAVNPLLEPVKVVIEETIKAKLQLEGGLDGEAECQGQFQVTVLDPAKAGLACFTLSQQNQDYKYKVHPNLNKASYANNILEVRDAKNAFRQNQPAPLLKWMRKSGDDAFLPVTLSCWPTSTADGTQIVLELELTDDNVVLEDIHIRFPVTAQARPQIAQAEPGEAAYDQGGQQVHWYIPLLDKNDANGTFEFTAAADITSMLPYTFEARSRETKCPMSIQACYHQSSNEAISYACEKSSSYQLVIDS